MINAIGDEQNITHTEPPHSNERDGSDHVQRWPDDRRSSSSSHLQLMSQHERDVFVTIPPHEQADWLRDLFSVREVSTPGTPPLQIWRLPEPSASAFPEQDMSLRTLAWLASLPAILSNELAHVVPWQEGPGQAEGKEHGPSAAAEGRQTRLLPDRARRPSGPTHSGQPLLWEPRTGSSIPRESNGRERAPSAS